MEEMRRNKEAEEARRTEDWEKRQAKIYQEAEEKRRAKERVALEAAHVS